MRLTLAKPAAVIFDMDGLLLDTESLAMRCYAEATAALGLDWQDEIGHAMIGLNAASSRAVLVNKFGDEDLVTRLVANCHERYHLSIEQNGIALMPFAREIIEQLKQQRIPRAVATSSKRERALMKLTKTQLLDEFDVIVGGDEVTRSKPAPDIFELAAQRLGVAPRDCLVLEDSNAGVRGAVSANMQVVMVPDLLRPDADIRRYGVQVADSLRDVMAALL